MAKLSIFDKPQGPAQRRVVISKQGRPHLDDDIRVRSAACSGSGKRETSTTLSISRMATGTISAAPHGRSPGLGRERIHHQLRQVDRAEQAGAMKGEAVIRATD